MPGTTPALLALEPSTELTFFKNASTTTPARVLKLTNLTGGHVAFKIKTTAPKNYLVRPSNGSLAARASCEVQIILQANIAETNQSGKPDRFLVQAMSTKDDQPVSKDAWGTMPNKEHVLNVKIEEGEEGDARPAPAARATGVDSKASPVEIDSQILQLESEKKKLEADLARAKSNKGGGGFSTLTLVVCVLVAVSIPHLMKFVA